MIATIEAATDRRIFFAYLDEIICPQLKAGDVAMMDNLSSHKVDEVRQRVGKCCATLLHLSPYSQDLNSIEKA
jgi:transposase